MRQKAKRIKKGKKHNDIGIYFEPLEPRLLLSGSWATGVAGPSTDPSSAAFSNSVTETVTLSDGSADLGSAALLENQHALGTGTFVDVLADAPVLDTFNVDNGTETVPETPTIPNEPSSSTEAVPIDGSASTPDLSSDEPEAVEPHELVFINGNVADYQELIADLQGENDDRAFEVVVLDADRDGIDQVSEILTHCSDLAAVHVITHGSEGQINLGNSRITKTTLEENSAAVAGWGNALTEKGDIFFMAVISPQMVKGKACWLVSLTSQALM